MNVVECPVCHTQLEAYNAQIRGLSSFVCPVCGAHFYSDKRTVPSTIPLVDIERFMPGHPRYSPYSVPELNAQVTSHQFSL